MPAQDDIKTSSETVANNFFNDFKCANGYFFNEFEWANGYGKHIIRSIFRREFRECKDNPVGLSALTEAVIREFWAQWDIDQEDLAALYKELYHQCRDYALDNLHGDGLDYFVRKIG